MTKSKLEALMQHAADGAIKNFYENGELVPIWLAEINGQERGILIPTPFASTEEQHRYRAAVREIFQEKDVVRYAFVSEIWHKVLERKNVLELPVNLEEDPEHREAILVSGEDKETGEIVSWMYEVTRNGDTATVGEKRDMGKPAFGGSMFRDEQSRTSH